MNGTDIQVGSPRRPWYLSRRDLDGGDLCAALDDGGLFFTDASLREDILKEICARLRRGALLSETSQPGPFAVCDLRRRGSVKRMVCAVGEGSAAVRAVLQH